jgi:hypothetical protein
MGCVPRVSGFPTRGRLKWNLERDVCHPSEWATYQPLVFLHVDFRMNMVSESRSYLMKLRVRGPTLALVTIHQDRRPGGIAGTQVARELILQGGPAIQNVISPRGYVSASEELRDERRVSLNHRCMPPQLENVK